MAVGRLMRMSGTPYTPFASWRAALKNSRNAVSRSVIAWVGDSVAAGDWAGTPPLAYQNQAKAASMPVVMAGLFVSDLGLAAMGQSFFGDATNGGTAYGNYNNKVAIGSFSPSARPPSVGGPMFAATAAATLAFTPGVATSRTDIYTPQVLGLGSLTINYDGGSTLATINEAVAGNVLKTTVNGSLTTHTINAVWVSGTSYIIGMDSYNPAATGVSVLNLAFSGTEPLDWVANVNSYDPGNALVAVPADLVIVHLGPNSWSGGESVANFTADLTTLVSRIRAMQGGAVSILLLGGVRSDPASVANYIQDQYVAATQLVAANTGCGFYDCKTALGDWTAANAAGWMANALHPNAAGYSVLANAIYQVVKNP
jgi:lysophospholipase L1-like esterase